MAHWKADDDSLIYFEVHGDGPNKETMLLLPGLLGAVGSQWNNFIPLLTPQYQIIIPDLRSHGRSENRATNLMPERMVADLHGLLDHLQVAAVHIAGYSLGGYLGLMLHLQDPRRVQSLVMHATKFYWTKEALAAMRQQLDPDAMAAKAPAYANQMAKEHGGSHWRVLVRQGADLVGYLSISGVTEAMAARAQCPVLVSVGDRDEIVPLPEALRLSRVFSHGELLTLPGVRHPFSSIREIPFVPMLREFPHMAAARRR